ncbi:MAG: hypothetical protein MUF64_30745 [Polyangiaceae bacterium]|jgi:hypothetical protein|nr:hypothetical protein [Polyangiaceae bacterium]
MQSELPLFFIPLILVGFLLFFVGLWSGISWLMAQVSGWSSMATRYPCPPGVQGAALDSGFAVRVGVASYRGVISFSATPQGLMVEVMALFPFHRPLLIPWSAIALRRGGAIFFAGEMQVHEGATFQLNGDALGAIERAMAR